MTGMSEHLEAKALIVRCTLDASKHPELALLFAIPNGGHRSKAAAGKLKAEGVKPGVSDYCLPVARGRWHGLFLELKAKNGRPSKAQREFAAAVTAQGYLAVICHQWEPAYAVLTDYLALGAFTGAKR